MGPRRVLGTETFCYFAGFVPKEGAEVGFRHRNLLDSPESFIFIYSLEAFFVPKNGNVEEVRHKLSGKQEKIRVSMNK